jgi:hypothetical protein
VGKIKCGVCHKEYQSLFTGTNQGISCASEVTEGKLIGHYGSEVADMDAFSFTKKALPEGTVICDACILDAMSKGEIVKIEPTEHMINETDNDIMSVLLESRMKSAGN